MMPTVRFKVVHITVSKAMRRKKVYLFRSNCVERADAFARQLRSKGVSCHVEC